MNLKLITAPASTPISLYLVKQHLRLPSTYVAEDSILEIYLNAAVKYAEDRTNRALVNQEWRLTTDKFGSYLQINKTPVIAVEYVKYYDTAGVLQTLAANRYNVISSAEPWIIEPAPGITFPSTQVRRDAVQVEFTAGYASGAVPKNIISAILLLVDDLWKNRGTIVTGTIVSEIPLTIDKLLDSERIAWL